MKKTFRCRYQLTTLWRICLSKRYNVMMAAKQPPWYLGGLASCVAAVCTHPLDLIKVRMQTPTGAAGPRRGAIATGVAVARQEGMLKLYAGLSGMPTHTEAQGHRV
jgi:hypothetical protein